MCELITISAVKEQLLPETRRINHKSPIILFRTVCSLEFRQYELII